MPATVHKRHNRSSNPETKLFQERLTKHQPTHEEFSKAVAQGTFSFFSFFSFYSNLRHELAVCAMN
jgi:hypothetical protein